MEASQYKDSLSSIGIRIIKIRRSHDGGGWQLIGDSLWAYRRGNKGQEPVVNGFPASPHSIQIPHLCRQARAVMKRAF